MAVARACRAKGIAPLIVKFDSPLSEPEFDAWVRMAFENDGPFGLWGDPIRLGPTKVHFYGADRRLWQPINIELTRDGAVAVMPRGVREESFRRLVENIRRHVCPKAIAWLGAKPWNWDGEK
jgi:hypothetical protein